jgi:hypothetical protein
MASKLDMAMVYKASRLAKVASKARWSIRTVMAAAKETAAMATQSTMKTAKRSRLTMPFSVSAEMKKLLDVFEVSRTTATPIKCRVVNILADDANF